MTPSSPPSNQAIYRRWRAQTFSAIVGQEAVVETLRNAVRTGRVAHAILFAGPRGTGKTSLARILAKALNCTDLRDGDPCDACESCTAIREGTTLDVVEIDAASNRGIDDVRELRDKLAYPPTHLKRKVYILDEAHQITGPAFNALLKSLEEPPEFVAFMFASTQPQSFPPAILSRLQRYDVRRLSVPEIEGKLARILEADGRDAEPAAVSLIARLAAGGMRDAESMLDQLLATTGDRVDERRVRDLLGLADPEAVALFTGALVAGDAVAGIRVLEALEDRGRDLRVFLDQVVEAIRDELRSAVSEGAASAPNLAQVAAAARRLAAIDPGRAGLGGLRLQLEIALLVPQPSSAIVAPSATVTAPVPERMTPERPAPNPSRRAAPSPPAEPEPPLPARAAKVPAEAAKAPAEAAKAPAETASTGPPLPVAASSEAPGPIGPDLALLRDRWPEIVASVTPGVRAVLAECRPLAVEENIVTLGFPETRPFLKDHAERKRADLEAAVGRFLDRAVSVRSVATNIELAAPAPADPDSAFLMSEARRIFADDLVDAGEVG